jgi:hypothetical protein
VSRPVKDICPYCYAFANHHRYLANCSCRRGIDGGNDGSNNKGEQGDGIGIGLGKEDKGNGKEDDLSTNSNDGSNNGNNVTNLSSCRMTASVFAALL